MQNVATSAFHSIKQMLYYQPLSLVVSTAKFIKQMLYYQPFSLIVSTRKFLKTRLSYLRVWNVITHAQLATRA